MRKNLRLKKNNRVKVYKKNRANLLLKKIKRMNCLYFKIEKNMKIIKKKLMKSLKQIKNNI